MTAPNASKLGTCLYNVESAWAESTSTFGTQLQLVEPVDVSGLTQDRIQVPITQQYDAEGIAGVRGPWGGQFTVALPLTGHGGATTGALSATDLQTLLTNFFGGGDVTQAGTTVNVPTDADTFSVNGGTLLDGGLIRVGSQGDGRGDGVFAAVGTAATVQLLTALSSAPNAADVCYASQLIYPKSSDYGAITSTRWRLMTADGQWIARGCYPMSAEFSGLNRGELPVVRLTYGVSRWDSTNATFPDTTGTDAKTGAIVGAGQWWQNSYGTSTAQTREVRNWSLSIDMQTTPLMGPGGVDAYQIVTGAKRTGCQAMLTATFDAEAAGTTTDQDIFDNGTYQHICHTLSRGTDGQCVGFYFRRAQYTSRPTQTANGDVNAVTVTMRCETDTTGSTDLDRSNWLLAMG